MFGILKKIFDTSEKETINIFETYTRIDYDKTLFTSLKVLTIMKSNLVNIQPFSVFTNLEILNLSYNKISDIQAIKGLKKLKIIDLRFNEIDEFPMWLVDLGIPLYWKRENDENEGIFLEGNPLPIELIRKLSLKKRKESKELLSISYSKKKEENQRIENIKKKNIEKKKEENEEKRVFSKRELLKPLNTQHLLIFFPKASSLGFINTFVPNRKFVIDSKRKLRINVSFIEYDESHNISEKKFTYIRYVILILEKTECCLHPQILESISDKYVHSQIFLVIENGDKNIEEKIEFFKKYNKSNNILDIYHSFNSESIYNTIENIYAYLYDSIEVKSLWKESWIKLKEAIEKQTHNNLTFQEYNLLAEKYNLEEEVREEIFSYLKRVGTIPSKLG